MGLTHAYLSASAAHRWSTCPASAVLAEQVPPAPAGAAADRGTELHALAEKLIREGGDPPPELELYVGYARSLPQGYLWLEQQVYYGAYLGVPDELAFGTSDLIHLSQDGKVLTVGDLKTGGMRVVPDENPQLVLYAVGALALLDMFGYAQPEQVRLAILQERASDEPMVWETTPEDCYTLAAQLAAPAQEAVRLRGTTDTAKLTFRVAEEACRYCPVAATCPALRAVREKFREPDFVPATVEAFAPVARHATNLKEAYEALPVLRIWIDAIESAMMSATLAGEDTGYKLVEGRQGNRKYADPFAVETILKAARIDPSSTHTVPELRSPAQMEKALKHYPDVLEQVRAFESRAPGKPTLAKQDDPRPGFNAAAEAIKAFASM